MRATLAASCCSRNASAWAAAWAAAASAAACSCAELSEKTLANSAPMMAPAAAPAICLVGVVAWLDRPGLWRDAGDRALIWRLARRAVDGGPRHFLQLAQRRLALELLVELSDGGGPFRLAVGSRETGLGEGGGGQKCDRQKDCENQEAGACDSRTFMGVEAGQRRFLSSSNSAERAVFQSRIELDGAIDVMGGRFVAAQGDKRPAAGRKRLGVVGRDLQGLRGGGGGLLVAALPHQGERKGRIAPGRIRHQLERGGAVRHGLGGVVPVEHHAGAHEQGQRLPRIEGDGLLAIAQRLVDLVLLEIAVGAEGDRRTWPSD